MDTLTEAEALCRITEGEFFDGVVDGSGIEIRLRENSPYLSTAIHAGSRLRPELQSVCLLSAEERRQEEDPCTDEMIATCPLTLVNRESRYEYDLNRHPTQAVYQEAWGKRVWKRPLTADEHTHSLEKHALYYRILTALVERVRKQFGACLILDLHSYNWRIRPVNPCPVFGIGTHELDKGRWGKILDLFCQELSLLHLPTVDSTVALDVPFPGNDYQAAWVRRHLPDTALLFLEVKKIYMDERSGEVYPQVVTALSKGLAQCMKQLSIEFTRQ